MLSRLTFCRGQSLGQCLLKFQPAFLTTSAGSASDKTVKKDIVSPPPGHLREYPPPTSKRDFVNFPKTFALKETPPPVRLGFIPESWFKSMYPVTGYTGPYIFLATTLIYGFSKEIIVTEYVPSIISHIGLFIVIQNVFGDKIAQWYNAEIQKEIDLLDSVQDSEANNIKECIVEIKKYDKMKLAVAEVTKANTELIHLQLENSFRERIMDVFNQVKNNLDCQAELENVERRMILKNYVNYVIRNVRSSITPDLEKNVLQVCISDLNALATRA